MAVRTASTGTSVLQRFWSNYADVSSVCLDAVVDYSRFACLAVLMDHTNGPLTTGQVAAIFGVTTTTVKRWADSGRLSYFRTPGGHYRFRAEDVEAMRAATEKAAS